MGLDRFDILTLLGLALLTAGLGFVYWPLALITPGVFLLAVGVAGARGSRGE